MATRAGLFVGELGHEGDRDTHPLGQFLTALLVDDVVVGHRQYVGVAYVEFVLPGAPLAFGAFDGDARLFEVTAHGSVVLFLPRSLQGVIVLEIPAGRLEVGVFLARRFAVRVAKEVILELRRGHYAKAAFGGRVQLLSQDRAGSHGDEIVRRLRLHIAQHDGRAVEPTRPAERGQVGSEMKVAVAFLPVREVVARNRLHLHVDGQQIVAGVGPRLDDLRDEVFGLEAFAHQAAVNVGEDCQNRVNFSRSGQFGEFAAIQQSRLFAHQKVCPFGL